MNEWAATATGLTPDWLTILFYWVWLNDTRMRALNWSYTHIDRFIGTVERRKKQFIGEENVLFPFAKTEFRHTIYEVNASTFWLFFFMSFKERNEKKKKKRIKLSFNDDVHANYTSWGSPKWKKWKRSE